MARAEELIPQNVRQPRIGTSWTFEEERNGLPISEKCRGKALREWNPPYVTVISPLVVEGPPKARLTQLKVLVRLCRVEVVILTMQPTEDLPRPVVFVRIYLVGVPPLLLCYLDSFVTPCIN